MSPFAKMLREPRKLLFYGWFYVVAWRPRHRRPTVAIWGPGHTRPNLSWKLFRLNGVREIGPTPGVLGYYHFDATAVTAVGDVLNGGCVDISKSHVAEVFAASAGYALAVDPARWTGQMVRKSEINALHDGVIVQGPIAGGEPGHVYQRLIDNSCSDDEVMDIRPCVIGEEIVFCYLKYRPRDVRFSNDNSRVTHVPTSSVLSPEEVALILRFCRAIGLDLGELDVLRDRADGRIYIVDVAKTPHSPGDGYISWAGIAAMKLAAASFHRQYLGRPAL